MNPFAPLINQLQRAQYNKTRPLIDRITELGPGLSQREIALQLGVSRSQVFYALKCAKSRPEAKQCMPGTQR